MTLLDKADKAERTAHTGRTEAGTVALGLPDGWQPIATAPKDGTRIIATWNPAVFGGAEFRTTEDPAVVRWVADHWKGANWYPDMMGTPYHVTHWQPLPVPLAIPPRSGTRAGE